MHVYVAGGSGAVGRRLVAELVRRRHRVTATTTTPGKLADLQRLGAHGVVVDGLQAAAVGAAVAMARPDAVVHQMTALSGSIDPKHFDRSFALTNRLRTAGLDHLIAAAEASGVEHVVVQSFTGWPNSRSGSWIKAEDDPLDPDPPAAQRESLDAITYLEKATAKVDGTALRYGTLYGAADDPLLAMVRKRRFPIVGGGTGYSSMVHLDDAVTATVLVLEDRVRGVFNIVDDEPAPASQWLPYLADCLGAKPPLRLPIWAARLIAGEAAVSMLTRTRGSSNARAKRALDWRLRWPSWREGFKHGLPQA
jgi:nucleoside-diphosphate-sugar epimerase